MNTQSKILTRAALAALEPSRPLLLATGYFDILRVELVRILAEARRDTGSQALIVAVLPHSLELLPQAARAQMAAALRVVDYVFTPQNEDLGGLAATLRPVEIIRLEEAETGHTRQLIEHVRRRQSG